MSLLDQDFLRHEFRKSKEIVGADGGIYDYDDIDVSDGLFNIDQQQLEDIRLEELRRDNITQQLARINANKQNVKTVREETYIDGTRTVKLRKEKVNNANEEAIKQRQKLAKKRLQSDATGGASSTSQLRDFPRSLTTMCRNLIPNTRSDMKAVAAFVYANRDANAVLDFDDIPEEIIELASTCDTYKTQESMAKNIRDIRKVLESLIVNDEQILYGILYLTYLRLSFNAGEVWPQNPRETNFVPKDIDELQDRFVIGFSKYKHNRLYQQGKLFD